MTTGVCYPRACTQVCCVGGKHCTNGRDDTSHYLRCMCWWGPKTTSKVKGQMENEEVSMHLMSSITLSSMKSCRLIFSWCICAPWQLFGMNLTSLKWKNGAREKQPSLSAMIDGLERILYHPGEHCNWIKSERQRWCHLGPWIPLRKWAPNNRLS